jgi:hypothetical protein
MSNLNKTVLTMLQVALSEVKEKSGKPLTREQISDEIDEITQLKKYSEVNKEWLLEQLEVLFTVWTGAPEILVNKEGHEPWLNQKKSEIDWRFWNRYSLYLAGDAGLAPAAIENIDRVSEDVLMSIEDPTRSGPWDRRGLVMGNVQSGKTGTYTGLICKASDAGYKIIVVLAGMHNNLRSQTQIRIDEGFLGYKAHSSAAGGFEATGVHKYGSAPRADSVTTRNNNGDFSRTKAREFAIQPGGNPLLFVVKKQATILKNLYAWIEGLAPDVDLETGRKFHRDVPILVIDDEADQASIDTKQVSVDENGNRDDQHNPTIINGLIRKILFAFDKSAYVGFTATPFANIFIHDENETKDLGHDLFPRSFIVNLPAPSNYIGASRVFGIDEDEDLGIEAVEPLPIVRIIDDYANSDEPDETVGWMPPKLLRRTEHIPMYGGVPEVPPSLRTAIMSFVLSTLVRDQREPQPQFNSMLVHVARLTNIQREVKKQVEVELKNIIQRITYGDGGRIPTILDEFEALWASDFKPTSSACGSKYQLPTWDYVKANLKRIASSIVIKEINGSAADALDYELHGKTGLNIIAVGGDKLSRGLTLEGLTVSYFLRTSRMYDTLMQMGRWFGYKEKYLDVCRLYTNFELDNWFRHIAVASEELRKEFSYMNDVGGTPKDYGLKVRSHPEMLVTSQLKMRSGTFMKLSYAGEISETVIFFTDPKINGKNLKAVNNLLDSIGVANYEKYSKSYKWSGVDGQKILDFLALYISHPDARRVDCKLISQYIKAQLIQDELTDWTVLLTSIQIKPTEGLNNDVSQYFNGDLEVGAIFRKKLNQETDKTNQRFTMKRLVDPSHEYADLNKDEWDSALDLTVQYWERSERKNKSENPPTTPGGTGVRRCRPKKKGLLILYPLLNMDSTATKSAEPIMGFAISFPRSDTAKEISYTVNNVFDKYGDLGD